MLNKCIRPPPIGATESKPQQEIIINLESSVTFHRVFLSVPCLLKIWFLFHPYWFAMSGLPLLCVNSFYQNFNKFAKTIGGPWFQQTKVCLCLFCWFHHILKAIIEFLWWDANHFCVKPNFNWGFVGGFTTKSQCYFFYVSTTKFQIIINHRHKRRRKYYISIGLQKKITKIRARKLPWQGE